VWGRRRAAEAPGGARARGRESGLSH